MPAAVDEQTAKARAMSERALYDEVAKRLKRLGWRYFHIPARAYGHGVRAGFPDITAVKGERLLFIELKREKEKLSDEQAAWAYALLGVAARTVYETVQYLVWRPSNLLSGEIAEILAGGKA